jgi:branched-chain amino acid transport system substrate-binding protein
MAQTAEAILQKAGVKTVYSKIYPAENPDFKAGADAVAATGAQLVVLGAVDVPTSAAFIQAFEQQHYNPKIFVATSGPDQGSAFTKAIGGDANATGIMVPGGWYGGVTNPLSQEMVKAYIAQYGGTAADINADVAEAYSVGEITASAVTATKGVDNKKITAYRTAASRYRRAGAGEIQQLRRNTVAEEFIFQWQKGGSYAQVLPVGATGSLRSSIPNRTGRAEHVEIDRIQRKCGARSGTRNQVLDRAKRAFPGR